MGWGAGPRGEECVGPVGHVDVPAHGVAARLESGAEGAQRRRVVVEAAGAADQKF